MRTFKVTGTLEVAGKVLGDSLTEADLGMANVDALIEGGHIVEIKSKPAKADSPQEQEI